MTFSGGYCEVGHSWPERVQKKGGAQKRIWGLSCKSVSVSLGGRLKLRTVEEEYVNTEKNGSA